MKWTVADARRRFAELIRNAAREPQAIYNRNRLVAAVVGAETLQGIRALEQASDRTLGEALGELREICRREEYELSVPERLDRDLVLDNDDDVSH